MASNSYTVAARRVHLASYCVPGLSAFRAAQPSPVCALAAEGSAELLVANGAGGLPLGAAGGGRRAFKHRLPRVFARTRLAAGRGLRPTDEIE